MKRIIKTSNAPGAVGPYNQAVEANGTLYVSGQIPLHPDTGKIVGNDILGQTKQVMENLKSIIQAAGYKMEEVVKCTCLLAEIGDFKKFNAIYAEYFTENAPSRATFQAAALPLGVLVEVDAIVVKT